jgi:hypothetical protein
MELEKKISLKNLLLTLSSDMMESLAQALTSIIKNKKEKPSKT